MAITWACERFQHYLLGMHFKIETDHKPLIPLLSSKKLDEMPIRVQRFRLHLMHYGYSINHVPGFQNLQRAMAFFTRQVVFFFHKLMEPQKEQSKQSSYCWGKNNDPYLAMLAYQSTPLENAYSPTQLSMG